MTHPGDPSNNQWQQPNSQPPVPPQQPHPAQQGQPQFPQQARLPQQPGVPQQPGQPWQQQPGGPAYGQAVPPGEIVLTLQGSPLTSNMLTPTASIDGYPVPASYGANRFQVPPGRHTVSAYATWLVKYGQASYDVNVQPGESVSVFYAAPMMQFMKGAMGPTKQQRGGKWIFAVVILVVIAIVVAVVIAGVS